MSAGLSRQRLLGALLLLGALAFTLRAVHLAEQPLIADDVDVGITARQFTGSGWPEPTMWNHPRLRDELVALSLDRVGETAWGLKAWSVVLGTLSAPALALLVLALGGGAAAALLAGLLVAVDPLHLDFSRQAINDVYLAFFPVAALAATWRYRATRATGWLALAGALFGLGLASKWSTVFPLAAAAAAVAADALRRPLPARVRVVELLFAAACLALLPLGLYLVTYLPWFERGYGLVEWARFHAAMAFETATHTGYVGTKRPGYAGEMVQAWRWFLQPVYYADVVPPGPGTPLVHVIGLGNPLTWLAVWPAAALAGWLSWRRRDGVAALLLALFAITYLPFALARRPIWTNSAVAVVPFAMALVAYAAVWLGARWPRAVGGWAAAALASAAILWSPAAGVSTRLADRVVRAVVPPIALVPKQLDPGARP